MILYYVLFVFWFIIVLLLIYNYKSMRFHKKVIESFQDELYMNLTDADKQLYFSIIDTYELLLDRDPSEDELNFEFNEIKTNKYGIVDLHNKLKTSMEYKQLNDIQGNLVFSPTTSNNDVQDYNTVVLLLKEHMPTSETEEDPVYIDFLVMKYRTMNKDKDKFVAYFKKTPEYNDYVENTKNKQSKEDTTKDTRSVVLTEKNNNVEHQISPPTIGKSTLNTIKKKSKDFINLLEEKTKLQNVPEDEQTCDFYNQFKTLNEETMLSDLQAKRELDKMKYHCELSKTYANVDSNITLLPGQEWTVPQKHTPVCHSQNCEVSNSLSQSALIGTLLEDSELNSKILPTFKYEEES